MTWKINTILHLVRSDSKSCLAANFARFLRKFAGRCFSEYTCAVSSRLAEKLEALISLIEIIN